MNALKISTLSLAVLAVAAACTPTEGPTPGDNELTLELSFTDLPALGEDFVYEGWFIVDDAPVTTGRFTVSDSQDFTFTLKDQAPSAFVLTIEPAVGDDPAPSAVHILAGDIDSDQADLTIGHPAALANDLTGTAASYILETPTDDVPENYANGIWFTEAGDLPALPEGWTYEGWVVVDGTPISTGRFNDGAAEDDDGAGPAAGPNGYPPVPGQDFVDPATNLAGATAVITVEPVPDDSPMPFVLKPLVDTIEDVGAGTTQAMSFQETSPVGTVVISR